MGYPYKKNSSVSLQRVSMGFHQIVGFNPTMKIWVVINFQRRKHSWFLQLSNLSRVFLGVSLRGISKMDGLLMDNPIY